MGQMPPDVMEETKRSIHYVDTFQHKLDARSRVSLPARWRPSGEEEVEYMALPHPSGCIVVYPPEVHQQLFEKSREVRQANDPRRKQIEKMYRVAKMLVTDKQGRVLIPEVLKQRFGIEKDVTFSGVGHYFEIWDTETFDAQDADFDFDAAMSALDF